MFHLLRCFYNLSTNTIYLKKKYIFKFISTSSAVLLFTTVLRSYCYYPPQKEEEDVHS